MVRRWPSPAPRLACWVLFSLITLIAHQAARRGRLPAQQAAGYTKPLPTLSDAIARVRDQLWRQLYLHQSLPPDDTLKIPLSLWPPFARALCYTAY
jgi:hypothetical protein